MATIFRHLPALLLLTPGIAFAAGFHSPAAIDARVADVLGTAARPVDQRLKLAQCPQALSVEQPVMGAATVRCDALGWRLRVLVDGPTSAGSAPVVVRRGDVVNVEFRAPGFSVTTNGIAESEARAGGSVRVRVEQKSNPVTGTAVEPGTVRVGSLN